MRYDLAIKTKIKIDLTNTELTQLQGYAQKSPLILMRLKSQAILLYSGGVTPEIISLSVNRTSYSIGCWVRDFKARRMSSIFSGHSLNRNASKLTTEQLSEIKIALASTPSKQGIPGEFWDVPKLKDYLSVEFSTVYESDVSYYFLLKFSGLSFKYPDTFDQKRDDEYVIVRMTEVRKEIAPLLIDDDWMVFSCDEVKMQREAVIRRCWLKRNERTIIKVDRKTDSQSYIGFLCQKTFKCSVYEMDWQNSIEVIKAMELFLKDNPTKKICIVWDNASFHKSQYIKDHLGSGKLMERVKLVAMPPYAPDENPIEKVWNTSKQRIANIQRKTFKETKAAFTDYLQSRTFDYSF